MTDFVSLLGVKGGPAIRPGSNMPTSTLIHVNGERIKESVNELKLTIDR